MKTMGLASVSLSMNLLVMPLHRRTTILFMLLLRAVRGPLRWVLHSSELQLHQGLLLVLLQWVLSFVPRRRRLQPRLCFVRLIQFLFLRVILAKAPVSLQVTCLAGIATNRVIGLGSALILRRMQIKVAVRVKFIILALKKFHRVR
jgi:hypothetical protein